MQRFWILLRSLLALTSAAVATLSCIEKTPPEVVIVSPQGSSFVSGTITIKAEVTDESQIEKVSFRVNDSLIAQDTLPPWECTWNTLLWYGKRYCSIVAKAKDIFGNEGFSSSVSVRVILPSNPPFIFASPWGPGEDQSPDTALTFFATGTDPDGDSISFQFDWGDSTKSEWTPYVASADTGSCRKTFTAEGTFFVRYRAKDTYGVTSEWSPEYTIRISRYGKLKWRCYLGEPVINSPVLGYDGAIYIGTEHYIHAVNPNGTIKWSYKVDPWRVCSSPAVGPDGTIYFGCYYYYLYALNPNGTLKWRYETERRVESSPAIGADGTIYFGTYDSSLVALTPQGTLKWEYKVGGTVQTSPAIGSDGTIYFGANDWYFYAVKPSGSLKWKFKMNGPNIYSSPAIGQDGSIVFASLNEYLYSLNPSGLLKNEYDVGAEGNVHSSPAIGVDGIIYISLPSWLVGIDFNENYYYSYGYPYWYYSSAVIGDDEVVYAAGIDSCICAFTPYLEVKWKCKVSSSCEHSIPVLEDSTLYTGAADGYFYAITTSSKGLYPSSWPKFRHDNQNTGRVGGP